MSWEYLQGVLVLFLVNSIAAMGVSLLTGFTGVFTLGHAAYMSIGAYALAIGMGRYELPWPIALLLAGVLASLVAYLVGVPTLRLVGDYFAIASIGLGETVRLLVENWQSLTRGARGYPGIEPFADLWVVGGIALAMGLAMFNLTRSRFGRAFKACRDDPLAASTMGVDTTSMRIVSLVVSAFYCGVAGALFASFMTYVQPAMFDLSKSTELTAVVVFGGLGSMSGTILAAAVITLVVEAFRGLAQYRMLIYGLVLVTTMVLRPEGIMGEKEIWHLLRGRRG